MTNEMYLKYKNKILKYANENGIIVLFSSDKEGDSNYYKHKKGFRGSKILVKRNQANNKKIAVLLHELGHYLDYKKDERRWKINTLAYDSVEFRTGEPLQPHHKYIIYKTEQRAWKEAKVLALQLNIPTNTWFHKFKQITLLSYKRLPVED